MVKYHPGQIKAIIGLTDEGFRHWRKVLIPLQNRKGKKARFCLEDIFALLIIKKLTDGLGIRIGNLTPISQELFDLCADISFPDFSRSILSLDLVNGSLGFYRQNRYIPSKQLEIIVSCSPIADEISTKLLSLFPDQVQQELKFPPTDLAQGNL